MKFGTLLLLFDEDNPCWTEETAALAGEDPKGLKALAAEGLIAPLGEAWALTEEGAEAFEKEAEANFLPLKPGFAPSGHDKKLFRSRLRLLLDKKHTQRWGIKEFLPEARFPIPALEEFELFTTVEGFRWLWPASKAVERIRSAWPVTGLAARRLPPPPADAVEEWFDHPGETPAFFQPDLLYLSRYDFESYASFPPLPGDKWGLLNADRFFFLEAPEPALKDLSWFLGAAGRFQLTLEVLRRMVLPGFMDLDSHDQSAVNWLIFVFEEDEEAAACAKLLSPMGRALIDQSAPMDLWALSFEGLKNFDGKGETIHDLLPVVGKEVVRTP